MDLTEMYDGLFVSCKCFGCPSKRQVICRKPRWCAGSRSILSNLLWNPAKEVLETAQLLRAKRRSRRSTNDWWQLSD